MRLTNSIRSIAPAIALSLACGMAGASERPNVLVIMADDFTYSDFPIYGGTNVETPNLNRLAGEGLVFDRAYVEMSMCTPSRAALYTGLYPFRNGTAWNHSHSRPEVESVVHRLEELGYRVGLAGKKHVFPDEVFPFETVPGVDGRAVSDRNPFDPGGIREFLDRDRDQPFFLTIASTLPHVPWTHGEPERFDTEELDLPPYFADTEQTREDYARYLAEIEFLDERVGIWLELLEESGQADDTLVFFTSEQGAQWPGAKWTVWAEGVQTALIARWPGRIDAGRRTEALVQYVDVLPTLVDLAGGEPEDHGFDGGSFLSVLTGEVERHRDFAYFMHNNVPEGPPYPIRGVTDGTFYYIDNLTPEALYIERHMMGRPDHNPYWSSWMYFSADDPHAAAMIERYMRRPTEELYLHASDPYHMNNVAGDPEYGERKRRLADALEAWMTAQGDPGVELDTREAFRASRQGDHFPLPD